MENASKALIIAGAILLAIVIISLGLVVVNNTRSVTDNANLNAQEIETFNNKFIAYEGTNVSAAKVKSLIQAAIASNNTSPSDRQIKVDLKAQKSTGNTTSYSTNEVNVTPENTSVSKVSAGKTYTVKLSYTKGLVSKITITEE